MLLAGVSKSVSIRQIAQAPGYAASSLRWPNSDLAVQPTDGHGSVSYSANFYCLYENNQDWYGGGPGLDKW